MTCKDCAKAKREIRELKQHLGLDVEQSSEDEIQSAGCVVAKANLEAFTAVAQGLSIPVNVIRAGRDFVIVDMSANEYVAVEGTLKQIKDDVARRERGRIARWLRSRRRDL